jgi:hypothetical protein
MSIDRVAHPYTKWEDYLAGMYAPPADPVGDRDAAFELLTDPEEFARVIPLMFADWPHATENWLTRPGAKSWPWIGAAACMWRDKVPEAATRAAWWLLGRDQQEAANRTAEECRRHWLAEREAANDA